MPGHETTVAAANVAIVHDKQANLVRFEQLAEEAAGPNHAIPASAGMTSMAKVRKIRMGGDA